MLDELCGRSQRALRLALLPELGLQPPIEDLECFFEHHVELRFVEEHLLDIFFQSGVVGSLIKFQGLDALDEDLDPHEDRMRVLSCELLLELECLRSVALVLSPGHSFFVDQLHY